MSRTLLLLPLLALPLAADTSGRRPQADPSRFTVVAAYQGHQKIWMLSPGGRWTIAKSNADVVVFDAATGKRHGVLKGHAAGLHDGGWSRDGRFLSTAGYDAVVKVWDVAALKEVLSVGAHPAYSCSCALSPDGGVVAAGGSSEGTLKFFAVPSGKPMGTVDCGGGAVYLCEFNPKGTHVVVSTGDNALKVVEVATNRVTVIDDAIGYVPSIEFSSDGRRMCGPAAGNLVIWDTRSWKEERRIGGQPRSCLGTFSSDGSTIAVTASDGSLNLWSARNGKQMGTLSTDLHGLTRVRFCGDGRSLVSAGPTVQVKVFGLAGDFHATPSPSPAEDGDAKGNGDWGDD